MKKKSYNCLFTDICGNLKEKVVFSNNKEDLINSKIHFDGSSVLGFTATSNSDAVLIPDQNTITANKFIFCDVLHDCDTRTALKIILKNAKLLGFDVKIGAEIEFYLFKKQNGLANYSMRDNKNYLSCCSLRIHKFIKDVTYELEKSGITLETIHHEVSNNQYEINFCFGDPIEVADKVMLIKQKLKWLSEKNGNYVSFMPKPFSNSAGSGMHINISIFKDNKNIFDDNGKLSAIGQYFANGVMNHIKAITAFSCPTINSYKRLCAKAECPNKIFISSNDRTALIRLPDAKGNAKRIEVRSPDVSANPYLTFASLIAAGINGIKNKETCKNENEMLPKTLSDALNNLSIDKFIMSTFPTISQKYIQIKQDELDTFNLHITDFELEKYF